MYFSVKRGIKIGGKAFTPCICYPLPRVLEANVNKLVSEGLAAIHEDYVFFQNGKIIEKKEEVPSTKPEKRAKRKITKEEAYAEDLVIDEEIADTF